MSDYRNAVLASFEAGAKAEEKLKGPVSLADAISKANGAAPPPMAPSFPTQPAGIDPSWLGGHAAPPGASFPPIPLAQEPPPDPVPVPLQANLDATTGIPLPPATAPPPGAAAAPPPPPNVGTPAGPPLPPEDTSAHGEFPLTQIAGGGVTPAHEVEMRGPTLLNAQGAANDSTQRAISANTANSEATAQDEYQRYLDQERAARAREAAMQQSIAERDQEMQDRQADFDNSVKSLSQMSMDPNRFWASRSTGQKVAAVVSMALGGFLQGARGGSNPGLDAINTMIDRDIHAQEMAYHTARDTVNAKQTAFGLAMQKYQNVDAARSMARAAALDTVQSQLGQNAALWKDTDAANRANSAIAQLQEFKAQQIAQGIRFVLPTQAGRIWRDRDGITYNEQQARELSKELRGHDQARQLVGLNTVGQLANTDLHGQLEIAKAQREQQQYGPEGKAGSEKLATEQKAAERERAATDAVLARAESNVAELVKGGAIGAAAAQHLPAGVPGVGGAISNAAAREAYNVRAMMTVAGMYKLSTDANEPKNKAILEHYSAPFLIKPTDDEKVARQTIGRLRAALKDSASARGAEPPKMSEEAIKSLTVHGGK